MLFTRLNFRISFPRLEFMRSFIRRLYTNTHTQQSTRLEMLVTMNTGAAEMSNARSKLWNRRFCVSPKTIFEMSAAQSLIHEKRVENIAPKLEKSKKKANTVPWRFSGERDTWPFDMCHPSRSGSWCYLGRTKVRPCPRQVVADSETSSG